MRAVGTGFLAGVVVVALGVALPSGAQVKVELTNEVGAKGPCLGLGLGMAMVGKCVSRAEEQGFLKVSEVGTDGLTIGKAGVEDGVLAVVEPGSAGATAGLEKGDRVISVQGKSVRWTPQMEVERQTFGEAGQEVVLRVKPVGGGAEKEVRFARGQAPMPVGSPKGSMLLTLMPLVDWRGRFVPCTAGGPMTPAVNAICAKEYAKYGYIRAKELGSVGFTVDAGRMDAAVVQTVVPGSSAAQAGLAVGDTIVAVDGKPLAGSEGELAQMYLFGKVGDTRAVVVERGGKEITETVVLGPAKGNS